MSNEKTEKPTPKKKKETREKGTVLKSKEIVTLLSSISYLIGFILISDNLVITIIQHIIYALDHINMNYNLIISEFGFNLFYQIALNLLLYYFIVVFFIITAHVIQFGFIFSFSAIKISLNNISPISGFKHIFGPESFIELLKNILKLSILTTTVSLILIKSYSEIINIGDYNLYQIYIYIKDKLSLILYCTIIFLFIMSIFDFIYTQKRYQKKINMSKEEIKQEMKNMEGNSEIKNKRKQFHRELQSQDIRKSLNNTQLVITNPTHLAIGLNYVEGKTAIPIITLKSKDEIAFVVRKIANDKKIPIFEQKTLARTLFEVGIIDHYIPEETFLAVIELLSLLEDFELDLDK